MWEEKKKNKLNWPVATGYYGNILKTVKTFLIKGWMHKEPSSQAPV